MAIRNLWVPAAAALVLAGVLGLAVFGGAAIGAGSQPPQPTAQVLNVPAQYATVQAAINAAQSGQTIVVAPGTYHENLLIEKPVALVAASYDPANPANNNVILDGGNTGEATVLIPRSIAPGPLIRGFAIRNSRDGIEAQSEFVADYDYFYGSQMSVEYLAGGGGINRNNVYYNSANDAIHIDNMVVPLLIQGNRFLYAGDDAIEVDLPGTSTPNPRAEVDIWDNMLIGSSQDGVKFVDYATNPRDMYRRNVIAGNLIAGNRRAGIGFVHSGNTNEDYSGADTAEPVRIYSNTFYGNDYGISGGDNAVVVDNIIANSTSRGTWRVQGPPGPNSLSIVAYTLFFSNRVDAEQSLLGPGNITGQDPMFVAPPNPGPDGAWGTADDDYGGLLLRPGSPAIDKGIAQFKTLNGELVPPAPLTGYLGTAPDLGWRELGSPMFITPTPVPTSVPEIGGLPIVTIAAAGPVTSTVTPAAAATATAAGTSTPAVTSTPALVLESVTPGSVKANSVVTLLIKGAGFQDGAVITFEGNRESPPQITSVRVADADTIEVDVDMVDDSSEIDQWNVRVTNPDGSTAMLLAALTVVP